MATEEQKALLNEKIHIPGRKTYEEVFDKRTLKELYDLMKDGMIDSLEHPISTGKEAKVFKGKQKDGTFVAVKIMRINTAVFRKYKKYIEGDRRFEDLPGGTKMIYAWTKKEFSNLKRMHNGDIRVPEPFAYAKNILIMEYLHNDDHPAPMLKDVDLDKKYMRYISEEVLDYFNVLYNELEMVHGDLSEFNILIAEGYPYLIDVSQSLLLDHPKSEELLERDINNLVRYFGDNGVDITVEEVKKRIGIEEV
ncbi:MAG: serine protein kinase RIO [Candidatus Thermoplasmatota archaeon]|nr:serine protein kinase RIO [Candidatus Thermoplasmatota archaeon]MBS3790006.1 serine protein kinase RIO [Candidatus Thermoplasmatota archaeon]